MIVFRDHSSGCSASFSPLIVLSEAESEERALPVGLHNLRDVTHWRSDQAREA